MGSPRLERRGLAALAVLAVVAASLAGCERGTVGGRCGADPTGQDGTWVLLCRDGRWERWVTIDDWVRFLQGGPFPSTTTTTTTTTTAPGTPKLTVTPVLGGLTRPWDVGFAPDGAMWVTQRPGTLSVRSASGAVHHVAVGPAVGGLYVSGELGLMGLAIDPSYASNRRLYTCQAEGNADSREIRVRRWTTAADNTGATVDPTPLARIDAGLSIHGGCQLEFGPDGYLWVGTGDAADGDLPQDPASNAGKVLRITTGGAGAPGNPLPAINPQLFTLGHRNVQGLAVRPDGQVFSVEHGPSRDDEINRLTAGANYGWAPSTPTGGYDQSRPMTDLERVPDAVAATWSSGSPTLAPSGATFLTGPSWGAWEGMLAVSHLKTQQVLLHRLDAAGTAVTRTVQAVTGFGRLRAAVQGPDGSLYVTQDAAPGAVLRITPT